MRLPAKVPGEHRWVAISTFSLTPGQASAAAAGSAVKLGPHNCVATSIGCVDCEREWPAPERCTAGAAEELRGVTDEAGGGSAIPEDERDRLLAGVGAVARAGGRALEVGYLEETADMRAARWWASARFAAGRVLVEEMPSPVDAVEGLAWRVLEGGRCVRCGKTIALEGHAVQVGGPGPRCTWRRARMHWLPGCLPTGEVEAYTADTRRRVEEALAEAVEFLGDSGPKKPPA